MTEKSGVGSVAVALATMITPLVLDMNPAAGRGGASAEAETARRLSEFYADRLIAANHGEIGLSRVAKQKASDPRVLELAELVIQDNERINQELSRFAPRNASAVAGPDPQAGHAESLRRVGRNRNANTPFRLSARETRNDPLLRVGKVGRQTSHTHLELAKSILQKHQGRDFDVAFVDMQLSSHVAMTAELDALQGVGSAEFQQAVQVAKLAIEQRLSRARELAGRLERPGA